MEAPRLDSTAAGLVGFAGRASDLLTTDEWRAIAEALRLSPRELQIGQGLLDGLNEVGLGERIGISAHTVHSHVKRMYSKTGARSHGELVARMFLAYLARDQRLRAYHI
jgi:DNA-binding NarL/FixJ family response regulator